MKNIIFISLMAVSLPSALCADDGRVSVDTPTGEQFELYQNSDALIISVADYANFPALDAVASDAAEVGGLFKKIGFDVEHIAEPGYADLMDAIYGRAFKSDIENRRLVIYFIGHGYTETLANGTQQSYFLARDTPSASSSVVELRYQSLPTWRVEEAAKRMQYQHVLFVFDIRTPDHQFEIPFQAALEIENIKAAAARPLRQFIAASGPMAPSAFQRMFMRALDEGAADLTKDGYITGTELGIYLQQAAAGAESEGLVIRASKLTDAFFDQGEFIFLTDAKRPSPLSMQ